MMQVLSWAGEHPILSVVLVVVVGGIVVSIFRAITGTPEHVHCDCDDDECDEDDDD